MSAAGDAVAAGTPLSSTSGCAIGDAFSFAGERCARIVPGVLARIAEDRDSPRS